MNTIDNNTMTNKTVEVDSIVLNCELEKENVYVFRASNDYNLKKSNIGAYKLTIDNCVNNEWHEVVLPGSNYAILLNKISGGGIVGILILINNVVINRNQVIFKLVKHSVVDDVAKLFENITVKNDNCDTNKLHSINFDNNNVTPLSSIPSTTSLVMPEDALMIAQDDGVSSTSFEVPEFKPALSSTNKTSLFDKYYVESRRTE
ncbi:tlp-20 [Matsumuraeses phaseoli granulovirus]|uniref:Tlp-20 n=1 Tax=Matsumuraeses phaseoli granulovirus TaxID=2760664 RepID=A0AAE7MLG7_9BBAC|nr:tlp-20 [Matsumuraeses phaseoli granulovirus]QOD40055.1 tlp-20 [Matsumuraeses phaseoli granulovirus]